MPRPKGLKGKVKRKIDDRWFYIVENKILEMKKLWGPVTKEHLISLFSEDTIPRTMPHGVLDKGTFVWTSSFHTWKKAAEVEELWIDT